MTHASDGPAAFYTKAQQTLRQARDAQKAGRLRMSAYHLQVALDCRRDARLLQTTAR